jgi:hypothetical protein
VSGFLVNLARRSAGLAPVVAASTGMAAAAGPSHDRVSPPAEAASTPLAPPALAAPSAPVVAATAALAPAPATVAVVPAAVPAPAVQRLVAPGPAPAPAWSPAPAAPPMPSGGPASIPGRAEAVPAAVPVAAPPPPSAPPVAVVEARAFEPAPAVIVAAPSVEPTGAAPPVLVAPAAPALQPAAPIFPAASPAAVELADHGAPADETPSTHDLTRAAAIAVAAIAPPVTSGAQSPARHDPSTPERVVRVRIGTIEIHGERPAAATIPVAAPVAAAAAPAPSGFERFARLRSYAPWEP